MVGICGVDPGPYQLRHILWMAKGRLKAEWDQTGLMAAGIWNAIRDHKKRRRPFTPQEMNPYAEQVAAGNGKDKVALKAENRAVIAGIFRKLRKR